MIDQPSAHQPTGQPAPSAWEQAGELPASAVQALSRPLGDTVVILATTDADGAPRTAAFGGVIALSPRRLRFGCNRAHDTYANLMRDGRVMLALYAPGVSVGIRGTARLLAEALSTWPSNAAIEVEVVSVKNDAIALAPVTAGIAYALPEEVAGGLRESLVELAALS